MDDAGENGERRSALIIATTASMREKKGVKEERKEHQTKVKEQFTLLKGDQAVYRIRNRSRLPMDANARFYRRYCP
jgi:hypothetical protein